MIKDIHQLQKYQVMQATQEFEILNLDDATVLSAQDRIGHQPLSLFT